ncbi:hypothetical protein ACO0QE_003318 [Hanseniaspora vineae]
MSLNNDILVTKLDPNFFISTGDKVSEDQLNKFIFLINSELDPNAEITTRPGVSLGSELILVKLTVPERENPKRKLEKLVTSFDKSFQVFSIESEFRKKNKHKFSSKLLKKLPLVKSLNKADLTKLGELTTPDVALHFAYAQTYIQALVPLAVCGAVMRFMFSSWEFNYSYTAYLFLWSFVFTNYWKHFKEPSLQYLASSNKEAVSAFDYDVEVIKEKSGFLFIKKLMFVPVAWTFMICLLSFQLLCFIIEIFLSQLYNGPLKSILTLTPIVLGTVFIPIITGIYSTFVDKMVKWENSPITAHRSSIEKKFTLTFMTSYVPLFITLFVYLPSGYLLNPYLNSIREFCSKIHVSVEDGAFHVDVNRFRGQFFYFTVTGQVIAIAMEYLVPLLMNIFKKTYKFKDLKKINEADNSQESAMLSLLRESVFNSWGAFDPVESYGKYIIQFGFITMFSTIWPLAPLVTIVFNIIIFKVDLWKALTKATIVKPEEEHGMPLGKQSQTAASVSNKSTTFLTIYPWNNILTFLAWCATLVSPSLILMYKFSLFPGVGFDFDIAMEKRSLEYLEAPISVDWKTIVAFVAVVEHFGFIINYIFGKLATFKAEKLLKKQQLHEYKEQAQLKDTHALPQAPFQQEKGNYHIEENNKGMTTSRSEKPVNESSIVEKTQTVPKIVTSSEPDAAAPGPVHEQIPKTTAQENTHVENQKKVQDPPTTVFVPPKAPSKTETSTVASKTPNTQPAKTDDELSIAGATLPKIIPTSENFDSRQNLSDTDSVPSVDTTTPSFAPDSAAAMTPASSEASKAKVGPIPAHISGPAVVPQTAASNVPQPRTQPPTGNHTEAPSSTHAKSSSQPVKKQGQIPAQSFIKPEYDPTNATLAPSAAAAALHEIPTNIENSVHDQRSQRHHSSRTPSLSHRNDVSSHSSSEKKKKSKNIFSKIKKKL